MELTTRQKATYDLIIANCSKGIITRKKEIVENYPFDRDVRKDGYVWNDNPKSHDHCSTVWEDIDIINKVKSEIIISRNGKYWVATKGEALRYMSDYFDAHCSPALKRYWNIYRKLQAHDTVDLFTKEVIKAVVEE